MNWKRWGTGCSSSGIQSCLIPSGKEISMVRSMVSDDMVYKEDLWVKVVSVAQKTGGEDRLDQRQNIRISYL